MREATVVSIVPFPLNEFKPGLVPNTFIIPASKNNVPELLVVKGVKAMIYLDNSRGSLFLPEEADKIAKSIVFDYCTSVLYSQEGCQPGLFWVPGELILGEVKKHHADKLAKAEKDQNNWFVRLTKAADDEWSKHHQHRVITDSQRYAARALGLEREWLIDTDNLQSKKCPACQSFIPVQAIVCSQCRTVIDAESYKKLNLVSVA